MLKELKIEIELKLDTVNWGAYYSSTSAQMFTGAKALTMWFEHFMKEINSVVHDTLKPRFGLYEVQGVLATSFGLYQKMMGVSRAKFAPCKGSKA